MFPALIGVLAARSGAAPIADFDGFPSIGASPMLVEFTDWSSNSPTSWLWDFYGDGLETSTLQNPVFEMQNLNNYPVLLMHMDDGVIDATGNVVVSGGGTHSFEVSAPGFGKRLVNVNAKWYLENSDWASISTQSWTVEAKLKLSAGQGGVLLCKNYWVSQPVSGFATDYIISINTSSVSISWSGLISAVTINYAFPLDTEFSVAITDDGTLMRLYVNGALVGSATSTALQTPIPPSSLGWIAVMGSLQGFLGSTPNWGSGFTGIIDELMFVIGTAKYTGATYFVDTSPFNTLQTAVYPTTLTVSNAFGSDTISYNFVLDPVVITPVITGPTAFIAEETLTLDGGLYSTPSSGAVLTDYLWSILSGTATIVGSNTNSTVQITSSTEGLVSIQLTVIDSNFEENSVSSTITVQPVSGPVVLSPEVFFLDASSYSAGQLWSNQTTAPADGAGQTAYDFVLGNSGIGDGSDPTHTGINPASYWTFDGNDFFTLAGTPTSFLKNMHKAGSKFSIEAWFYYAGTAASNVAPLFDSGTSDQSGSDMSRGIIFSDLGPLNTTGLASNCIRVKQDGGGQNSLNKEADSSLTIGWHMVACSIDGTGTTPSFLYTDGDYDPVDTLDTWDGTFITPGSMDAALLARIGARGDGGFRVPIDTKLIMLRVHDVNVSKSQFDASWVDAQARFAQLTNRYWRFSNIAVAGSFLEMVEFQLLSSGVVQSTGAPITSSSAPAFGALTTLNDGDFGTRCYWTQAAVQSPGFSITITLPQSTAISSVRLGGYDTADRFLNAFTLETSTDNTNWTTVGTFTGVAYPGNAQYTEIAV